MSVEAPHAPQSNQTSEKPTYEPFVPVDQLPIEDADVIPEQRTNGKSVNKDTGAEPAQAVDTLNTVSANKDTGSAYEASEQDGIEVSQPYKVTASSKGPTVHVGGESTPNHEPAKSAYKTYEQDGIEVSRPYSVTASPEGPIVSVDQKEQDKKPSIRVGGEVKAADGRTYKVESMGYDDNGKLSAVLSHEGVKETVNPDQFSELMDRPPLKGQEKWDNLKRDVNSEPIPVAEDNVAAPVERSATLYTTTPGKLSVGAQKSIYSEAVKDWEEALKAQGMVPAETPSDGSEKTEELPIVEPKQMSSQGLWVSNPNFVGVPETASESKPAEAGKERTGSKSLARVLDRFDPAYWGAKVALAGPRIKEWYSSIEKKHGKKRTRAVAAIGAVAAATAAFAVGYASAKYGSPSPAYASGNSLNIGDMIPSDLSAGGGPEALPLEAPTSVASEHVATQGEHLWGIGKDMLEKAGVANPTDTQIDAVKDELVRTNKTSGSDNQIGLGQRVKLGSAQQIVDRIAR